MVREENNVGSCMDEGLSSSSYEDVPSRVDAIGVITWLRLVGEPQAGMKVHLLAEDSYK